ncbi:MAG: phospholipase D-like domain-containing protein [Candidatus Eisenbacteria bacterium]
MRHAPLLLIPAFLLAAAATSFAVPIGDLHVNTSSGVQNVPYQVGTTVTVTGVVTTPDSIFSDANNEVQVQDSTGAVTVFRSGGLSTYHYNLGDSVTVTGQIAQFNGLTEISNASIVTLHSTGNYGLVVPVVRTCRQVRDSTFNLSNFREDLESSLITINNVTVNGGTWPAVCAGANTTVTIIDASGVTINLFIDKDGPVCGSSNPSGPFNVTGVLSQFKSAAPYTSGYEIRPRFASDIVPLTPGPNFVGIPTAVNVDSVSADITWGTDVNSSSIVEYGLTTGYGTTLGDSTQVTAHLIHLAGLTPNKLYHFRVTSLNGLGSRQSADYTFATPSNLPGQINFFFNKSIDAALANPDTAQGNVDLQARAIAFINRATYSIDLAAYSFNSPPFTDALIARWNAGIKVRYIIDAGNTQTEANRLRNAGIPVITSTYGGSHSQGIMHNKFCVVDGRDGTASNDWLWTGSTNFTTTQFLTDSNNSVEIQDFGIAQCYLEEFNEMWGSDTDTPNAAVSKMGNRKVDNTPHFFHVNGIPIEVYFAPSDGVEGKYTAYIGTADYGIDFSILSFTSNPIEEAFRAKWNGVPGFYLRGVFDAGSTGDTGAAWPQMKGLSGNVFIPAADVFTDTEPGMNHDKYMIIDEGRTASDPTLITGSYNWSNAANTVNDENSIIFHSQKIANLYQQAFARRYQAAGGTADLTVGVPATGSGFAFAPPSPNPALSGAVTSFAIDVPSTIQAGARVRVVLYSVTGRKVRTLLDKAAAPGTVRATWNGLDDDGRAVAPGVYLARATVDQAHLDRKVVRIP